MILYDYECTSCGSIKEVFHPMGSTPDVLCSVCEGIMNKVVLSPPHYQSVNKQDAQHIRDGAIAFDPEDERPEIQTFLKDKTRDNLKTAMKTAGIRYKEDGEDRNASMERRKVEKENVKERTESIMKKRQKDRAVTLR